MAGRASCNLTCASRRARAFAPKRMTCQSQDKHTSGEGIKYWAIDPESIIPSCDHMQGFNCLIPQSFCNNRCEDTRCDKSQKKKCSCYAQCSQCQMRRNILVPMLFCIRLFPGLDTTRNSLFINSPMPTLDIHQPVLQDSRQLRTVA